MNTQRWGAPVFSVVLLEVELPILTEWGLLVRKFRIQLQREVKPSRLSFPISCCWMIVLNDELKSMNIILT